MTLPSFAPPPWNLSVSVALAVVSACSPSAMTEDGTAATDTTVETDTTIETDTGRDATTQDGAATEAQECRTDDDCSEYTACEFGHCVDTSCESGPDCDYGCQKSYDCAFGELCEADEPVSTCVPISMVPECAEAPSFDELPLPGRLPSGLLQVLAFLPAQGDASQELVIGTTLDAILIRGPELEMLPIPLPPDGYLAGATGGDVDGDGDIDIVVVETEGVIRTILRDATGELSLGPSTPTGHTLGGVAAIQWDGGALDLVAWSMKEGVDWHMGFGNGFFKNPGGYLAGESRAAPVLAQLNDDAFDDVLFADGSYVPGGGGALVYEPGFLEHFVTVYAGDLDQDGRDDIIATSSVVQFSEPEGWTSVEVSRGPEERAPTRQGLVGVYEHGAVGDVTGDGVPDIVFAGAGTIAIAMGQAADLPIACVSIVEGPADPNDVVLGDLDGDGRLEIVVTDGADLTIFSPTR